MPLGGAIPVWKIINVIFALTILQVQMSGFLRNHVSGFLIFYHSSPTPFLLPVFLNFWPRNGAFISDKYVAVVSKKYVAVISNNYAAGFIPQVFGGYIHWKNTQNLVNLNWSKKTIKKNYFLNNSCNFDALLYLEYFFFYTKTIYFMTKD